MFNVVRNKFFEQFNYKSYISMKNIEFPLNDLSYFVVIQIKCQLQKLHL